MDQPRVAVVMGSQSDWATMRHAAEVLERLGVPHVVRIVSINESGGYYAPPPPMPPMMAMERATAQTKIEPGEQKLQVTLAMTFELQ